MKTRKIPLTKGYVAIIDAADADLVNQYNWYAAEDRGKVYAATRLKSTRNVIKMHRLITGATAGRNIRWKNDNTLDNRRNNLTFPSTRVHWSA